MPAVRSSFFRLSAVLLFAGLAWPGVPASLAQESKTLSEPVAAELGKLRELTETKAYAPALQLIDRLLVTVPADSYDVALLSQIKAQIFLTQGQYTPAIAPLEKALQLGEHFGYLTESAQLDALFLLAQLYQQQATEIKEPARQRPLLEKAAGNIGRWQERAPRLTPEVQLFAASLFYQQAMLDPSQPDLAKLRATELAVEKALPLQIRPSTSLYVLWLAALQQRGDYREATDVLELLVQKQPDNTSYWQQLVSSYLALAGNTKDDREIQRYNLRALLTLERAQARGFLTAPRENFSRVALYLSLQQFAPAIALLEKGLADGSIENTRRNWELLASTYQQQRQDEQAIATLEKAALAFPQDGQLEFTLAQHVYARGQPDNARRHLEKAVRKGRLDKPGQTRLFLAYAAYELKSYPEATRWVQDAAGFDDVKKEDIARLIKAIAEAAHEKAAGKS